MKRFLILAAAMLWASSAAAQGYGSRYDWRSGNSYNWNRGADGTTSLRGFNGRTGSSWNTRITPNGDQRGLDSRGHSWSYDAGTGAYRNSDGSGCIGKGAARNCW